jgi:hypothetical protein
MCLPIHPSTHSHSQQVIVNGGFFFANLFSFFHPTPLAIATPPELLPYGWTSTDLWSAPLITGLYALLTHAQPFWADAHALTLHFITGADKPPQPVDPDVARAACALILAGMFAGRTVKNFSGQWNRDANKAIQRAFLPSLRLGNTLTISFARQGQDPVESAHDRILCLSFLLCRYLKYRVHSVF